jgi:NAD-dependent deacetylase
MKCAFKETEHLVAKLKRDSKIVVLTGAGVSAESGIPTFRDSQEGLWADYDPEELASPRGFAKNPKLVFDWYSWRRGLVQRAKPNDAHKILAEWAIMFPQMTLVTQNVDGLHQMAGSPSVIEIHGNIHQLTCLNKAHLSPWIDRGDDLPRCRICDLVLRPNIVWFGESLDSKKLSAVKNAVHSCDIFLAIGTSGIVYPAAGFIEEAKMSGAYTVIINKEEFSRETADLQFVGPASQVLMDIKKRLLRS